MLIRKLELVLENCEVITIDGKYIGDFYAGDIRKEVKRMACNHIGVVETCHSFYVEIHKDADKEYMPFGLKDSDAFTFKRLTKYDDITSVYIYLYEQYGNYAEDESKDIVEHYLLAWNGDESEQENTYQKSKISKTGWLYLVVDEEKKLSDVFELEEIDAEEVAKYTELVYDLGDELTEISEKEEKRFVEKNICKSSNKDNS